jgi:exodeoxyribonuclease VII large subunit
MRGHRLDAIVLGRGGGSSEDLSAFNTEVVAAAMVHSEVPVISAVGHEVDYTVADQVADYRALTPTEAIVTLCPDRQALVDDLQNRYSQMTEALKLKIRQRREKLQNLQDRPVFRRPLYSILKAQQFLDDQQQRLTRAIDQLQAQRRLKISSLAEHLDALSPLKILRRGYSIVISLEPQKAVLRSSQDVDPGQQVEIRFADGSVVAEIQRILHSPQTETRS